MSKYGLIGGKLGHSYSMGIHKKYFDIIGEESSYDLIETSDKDLKQTIMRLKNEGYSGLNVTIPHKKSVMEYADVISPEASSIGAVNTLKFSDGKVYAYNTDYYGIKKTFEKFNVQVNGKDVYILGTGGAANAVSTMCSDEGGNVIFVSRTPSVKAIGYEELKSITPGGVLVNCTPVGMYPDTQNTPTEYIDGFESIVDIIYNPVKTKLLANAKKQGINAVNGLYMLVTQAVYSETIWHGTQLDEKIIETIYEQILRELKGVDAL